MNDLPVDSAETGGSPSGGPLQTVASSMSEKLGWRGWLVLLALGLANLLIVAILYQSFYLGQ